MQFGFGEHGVPIPQIHPSYPMIVPSNFSVVFGSRATELESSSRGSCSHRRCRHQDVSVPDLVLLPPPTGGDKPQPVQEHNFGEFMSFHSNPNEPRAMPSLYVHEYHLYVHEYHQDSNDDYVPDPLRHSWWK